MSNYALTNTNTGEVEQTFESLPASEIPAVIETGHQAFLKWKDSSMEERISVLTSAAKLFEERKEELAEIIGREMGKPRGEALGEIQLVVDIFNWYATEGPKHLEDTPLDAKGAEVNLVRHEPLGVLLGVMPWNFPYYQLARFAAPNLLVGNTMLMKQASICPVSSAAFEKLLIDAGLPEGAYQNLYLDTSDIELVLKDFRVKGVSLTGSERAGSSVAELAGKHLKKSMMELGGNDPAIVLADVESVSKVAQTLANIRFLNAGQVCVSPKRVIVVEDIYDEFVAAAKTAVENVKVGDADAPDTQMGPLSSEAARDEAVARIEKAVAEGATLHAGGKKLDRPGWFMSPALLTDVDFDADLSCNELFGPALVVYKVKDEAAAIKFANASEYGLQASVWTSDLEHGLEVADQIVTGMTLVNEHLVTQADLPFGGINKSGYGRELTQWGLLEFTNEKLVRGRKMK
ncbi:MAG: NAD-dependent succinate-semialdehyde dehydrogenase [Rothia sp. (in: high G+C Gram-positive bacteria)]|nr:NAD-dependent succinate-semialdehyde dehydrogenase [Rothia sp. (in: high G+C Gram-positive bacteria)]